MVFETLKFCKISIWVLDEKCVKIMFIVESAYDDQNKSCRSWHGDAENVVD